MQQHQGRCDRAIRGRQPDSVHLIFAKHFASHCHIEAVRRDFCLLYDIKPLWRSSLQFQSIVVVKNGFIGCHGVRSFGLGILDSETAEMITPLAAWQ